MSELEPSNESVGRRLKELETKVRRVAALVAAVQDMASQLRPGSREVEAVQSLLQILGDESEKTLGDALWLNHSFVERWRQIEAVTLRNVA